MPYTAVSYLALPRLHPELAAASPRPLPEGTLFLWPGLPRPPQSGVFAPDYPWTPDQAAACLADFERAGREGVRGAPVAAFSALGALGAGDDLSPEERRALSELMGELSSASDRAVDANDETGRQAAQRTLLLAWLQEKQVLELRELEQRVRRGQSALAGLLGEGVVPEADFVGVASGGASLPPWRSVLASPVPTTRPYWLWIGTWSRLWPLSRPIRRREQTKMPGWGRNVCPKAFPAPASPWAGRWVGGGPCRNRRGPSFLSIPPPGCNPESA